MFEILEQKKKLKGGIYEVIVFLFLFRSVEQGPKEGTLNVLAHFFFLHNLQVYVLYQNMPCNRV